MPQPWSVQLVLGAFGCFLFVRVGFHLTHMQELLCFTYFLFQVSHPRQITCCPFLQKNTNQVFTPFLCFFFFFCCVFLFGFLQQEAASAHLYQHRLQWKTDREIKPRRPMYRYSVNTLRLFLGTSWQLVVMYGGVGAQQWNSNDYTIHSRLIIGATGKWFDAMVPSEHWQNTNKIRCFTSELNSFGNFGNANIQAKIKMRTLDILLRK